MYNRSKWLNSLKLSLTTAALLSVGLATSAQAGSIVSNGTIQLGIDDLGQLNIPGSPSSGGTSVVGLRYLPTNAEATAPGCLCEGWGVADGLSGETGFANNSRGSGGLSLLSFTSDGTSATSVVATTGGLFEVTHAYSPDARTSNLYKAAVTIKNLSASTISDVRYRRVMDWDIEPTAFSEFVTIKGTAAASAVLFASDDGFANSNPLSGPSSILKTGDFEDSGPADHGALFDFGFGSLESGKSVTFDIFYGAAATEAEIITALAAVKAEVFSLGQANVLNGPSLGVPNTFAFGFSGVGGVPIDPTVPTPALLPALIGMGAAVLRKRKAEAAQSEDA